ncbi:MAG: radical SAM protein [Candidatus Brocadiales bacterium]
MHSPQVPEFVKTSLASALTLRFLSGRFYRNARNFCINLLLSYPDGCRANCAYCGLARSRPQGKDSFIRVDWPALRTSDIVDRLSRYRDTIRRVCISTVFHPSAVKDTINLSKSVRAAADIPLSVLITPGLFSGRDLRTLRTLGADYLGVGLDAASERVFELTRGARVRGLLSWEDYINTLRSGVRVFGHKKVSCHIMVGIGETDRELVESFFRVHEMGALIHLFSFYPEPYSRMSRRKRPTLKRFRRAQLLAHLVERDLVRLHELEFDSGGKLTGIKPFLKEIMEEVVESGRPFITGGCPGKDGGIGCNRPFGSYRPGEPFRDFPFQPEPGDIARIKRELRPEGILQESSPTGRKRHRMTCTTAFDEQ